MSTAEFHRNAEAAGRRIERIGRTIARVGREITMAISLPLLAAGFAVFRALLEESHRQFGPLYADFQSLKANAHDLFIALGRELQPIFLQIIDLLRRGIGIMRGWIAVFHELPQWIKMTVIYTLLFLAALGPTVLFVGKFITAIGALIKLLPIVFTVTNLATGGILLIGAAMIYAGTHTDWTKYRLALFATFLVEKFFQALRVSILAIDVFTMGISKLVGWTDFLRRKVTVLEDEALGKLGGTLVELENRLPKVGAGLKDLGNQSLTTRAAIDQFYEAQRRLSVQARLLGSTFDYEGAQAANLKTLLDALIANNVTGTVMMNGHAVSVEHLAQSFLSATEMSRAFNEALGALGPRLDQQVRAIALFRSLLAAGVQPGFAAAAVTAEGQIIQAQMQGILDALTAIAERIGDIFAGVRRGFHGFAAQMGALLGAVLKQIGQTLVQMGIAAIAAGKLGLAIKAFAKNPFAAIAAGVALIALGQALAASAQRSMNQGLGGGGGGGSSSFESSAATSSQGESVIILELRGDAVVTTLFQDPRNQDALAEALSDLSGRRVRVEPRSVA
jgi:hypothetical protein